MEIYLQENPCKHPVIILRDSSYDDIEGLVRYVYRGEVDVQPEQLQSFLRTAELLQIKGLADQNLCNTATESEAPLNSPNRSSPDVPIVAQEDDKKRIRTLSPPLSDEVPVIHNRNQGIASPNIGIHQQIGSPGENVSNFPSQQITQQSSYTSGCSGTNGKNISTSQQPCIKVPVPPTPHLSSLKRTNFTNLAQYLSGSSNYQSVTSPSSFVSAADGDNIDSKASNIQNLGGSVAKRRKVLIFLIV